MQTRLYSLTNVYLSSIQKGIQTAHLVSEIGINSRYTGLWTQWAKWDKTIIILNGGNAEILWMLKKEFIDKIGENYPNSYFCEDIQSLGGVITAIGFIVPEDVYTGKCRNKIGKMIYNKLIKDFYLAI